MHILTIENKGYAAFQAGEPLESCPYMTGYRNQNGRGGSVQAQRREAWRRGYDNAARDAKKANGA
jgi:hypothetical protein